MTNGARDQERNIHNTVSLDDRDQGALNGFNACID
jgi:hypothetical protein